MTKAVYTNLIDNIGAESENIPIVDSGQFRLFSTFAESDLIDEAAIGTASVHQEKLVLIVKNHCMLPRQNFAREKRIVG